MEKDADGNFKINGQKVLIPFVYKSTDNMMIQMLRQQDAPYSTEDGEIRSGTLDGGLLTVSAERVTLLSGSFQWNE